MFLLRAGLRVLINIFFVESSHKNVFVEEENGKMKS